MLEKREDMMPIDRPREVWIVGHRSPDTDSICAAIAYADLKSRTEEGTFLPKRAGEINLETKYVLDTFDVAEPELVTDVSTQVMDIEIRPTKPVSRTASLKQAWELMKEQNVVTIPVTDKKKNLKGLITTGDIATSYMEIYDSEMLSKTDTRYQAIADTLEGEILCGDADGCFKKGKVMVGSASPEIMEEFMDENDLAIMGARYEAQLCAIENNASAIVITGGAKVSKTIVKLAQEHGCVLITTPYDTFTATRLINQSMAVKYFMRKKNLISFGIEEHIDAVRDVMSRERHRDFPVLDDDGKYIGMISRRNLLNMRRKQMILVDHNEKAQAVEGIDSAEILEIIDHHRLGSLETLAPVFFRNQPVGCTATIIYQMYQEKGVEITPQIAGLLCSAILSDTLMFRSPTCTPLDKSTAERLAEIAGIEVEAHAKAMFRAGSDFNHKTADEIFHQDFKIFDMEDEKFGVSQISAMTKVELEEVLKKLSPELDAIRNSHQIGMVFVMLTNIMEETTYLLCQGDGAEELAERAFDVEKTDRVYPLKGIVSRKKQLIPKILVTLQQE
jgi:manganese-dependent inorganic pyrophosphatase